RPLLCVAAEGASDGPLIAKLPAALVGSLDALAYLMGTSQVLSTRARLRLAASSALGEASAMRRVICSILRLSSATDFACFPTKSSPSYPAMTSSWGATGEAGIFGDPPLPLPLPWLPPIFPLITTLGREIVCTSR